MLHGSETWPTRKENEVVLQWAVMRMVRRVCGIKLQDKHSNYRAKILGLDDIILALQQNRLQGYGQ